MMNKTALSIADLDTGRMLSVFVQQPTWDQDAVQVSIGNVTTLLVTRQAAEELAYALLKAATSAVVQNAE
jgi:hypothetical protein